MLFAHWIKGCDDFKAVEWKGWYKSSRDIGSAHKMHTHLRQVKQNVGEFNIKMVMKEHSCQLKEGYQDNYYQDNNKRVGGWIKKSKVLLKAFKKTIAYNLCLLKLQ